MAGEQTDGETPTALPARIASALEVLMQAAVYAEQTCVNAWEFAVEIDELRGLGLSRNDLRWLVRTGRVEHAREVTVTGDHGRAFRPTGDLTFTRRTCFILTPKGIVNSRAICRRASGNGGEHEFTPSSLGDPHADAAPLLPKWDADKRELSLNGRIVKRFKWHAMNQEAVLAVFEEEGWPVRIDDPLPPLPEQDPKRRLSDTIKCLNRKQRNRLIHFRGDGTGEGVVWELVGQDGGGGTNG